MIRNVAKTRYRHRYCLSSLDTSHELVCVNKTIANWNKIVSNITQIILQQKGFLVKEYEEMLHQ